MWNIVWVSPQGHRSVSVNRHFFYRHGSVPVPCENGSAETIPLTDINNVEAHCHQTYLNHRSLLTTLHDSCEDLLMHCISVLPSVVINGCQHLFL